jgi:excisionase family DNA binding protein
MEEHIKKLTYNAKEAAEVLGVGAEAVRRLARSPSFPAIKIGKGYRIPIDGLNEWMKSGLYNTKSEMKVGIR